MGGAKNRFLYPQDASYRYGFPYVPIHPIITMSMDMPSCEIEATKRILLIPGGQATSDVQSAHQYDQPHCALPMAPDAFEWIGE